MQLAARHRPATNRRHWEPERGQVLTHRGHLRHHASPRGGNLHAVRRCPPRVARRSGCLIDTPSSCPTECRLVRKDAPWQCIVSVRLTTDPAGAPLGQARTHQFGAVIFDKGEVEERIRRAQRAILNPSKPFDAFLTAPEADAAWKPSELAFSKNCITLQISGPDVTDLSFCDLPGMSFGFPAFVLK